MGSERAAHLPGWSPCHCRTNIRTRGFGVALPGSTGLTGLGTGHTGSRPCLPARTSRQKTVVPAHQAGSRARARLLTTPLAHTSTPSCQASPGLCPRSPRAPTSTILGLCPAAGPAALQPCSSVQLPPGPQMPRPSSPHPLPAAGTATSSSFRTVSLPFKPCGPGQVYYQGLFSLCIALLPAVTQCWCMTHR